MAQVYQDIQTVTFSEPRIAWVKAMLEELLGLVELEFKGEAVQVDGFRLRNLEDWVHETKTVGPDMVMDGLARRCNTACQFCYVNGTPPDSIIRARTDRDAQSELAARLELYDESQGRALFRTVSQWYEPFCSPDAIQMLTAIRQKSKKWLVLTTNGRGLTPEVISRLAQLQPIYLVVSLNSADPARRSELMRDPTPEVAIQSLKLLRENGIPFAVSCVPWPTLPLSDVEQTLRFAAEAGAQTLRISLPGYTRYNGDRAGWFDTEALWHQLLDRLLPLRAELHRPLLFYPSLFEELHTGGPYNQPVVHGVGPASPAEAAGFEVGDTLVRVNGSRVISRPHARDMLNHLTLSPVDTVTCLIDRKGQLMELTMDDVRNFDRYGYPYSIAGDATDRLAPFGLYIPSGFRRNTLTVLKRAITERAARRVMVVTSWLMRPLLEQAIDESDFYRGLNAEIHLVVPESRYYGGGISMGDLLVNSDIISAVREFTALHGQPDLVCLSESMFTNGFGWRRDLNGHYYREIERMTGVPIQLIEHETITW